MTRYLKKNKTSVLLFIVIAYLVSWPVWLYATHDSRTVDIEIAGYSIRFPLDVIWRLPGDIGPGVAAIVVAFWTDRKFGVRSLLMRSIPRWDLFPWIAVGVTAPIVIVTTALFFTDSPLSTYGNAAAVRHWLAVFIFNLPFAPFCEELGWRGYLLPTLRKYYSPISAMFSVGAIWALWHTPLYANVVLPGSEYGIFPLLFFASTIGVNMLFTWLYDRAQGNLSVTILFHASFNASILALLGPGMAKHGIKPFVAMVLIVWVCGLATLVSTRGWRMINCNERSGNHAAAFKPDHE